MATYAIVAAVSYLLGSIPFGYILVRVFLKQDIRTTGSGNIGATNVGRTGHKGLAIATLLLDAGKGFLAVIGTIVTFAYAMTHGAGFGYGLAAFAGLCAILGHMFPVWLKFKGGKGVATAVGSFAVLAPRSVLIALGIFLVTVLLTRYVSLGSILAAISFPIVSYFLPPHLDAGERLPLEFFVYTGAAALLIVLKHHQNIGRLLAGSEHRLGAKSKLPPPQQMEKQA